MDNNNLKQNTNIEFNKLTGNIVKNIVVNYY